MRVPNTSGRAGMAAITLNVPLDTFNTAELVKTLQKHLPSYAIPIFLRVRKEHEITGTFKNRKVELKRDGFNLEAVNDPVYWYSSRDGKYKRLDPETLRAISSGEERI